jgi:glycosyltransferase involved in cell wall biosynthesis
LILGNFPEDELAVIYNGAIVTVYPSLYEGFGLPIIESMACGTPVICSNVSSMPEIAGSAAVLFDPKNLDQLVECLRLVIYNEPIQKELKAKGLMRAKNFTWRKVCNKVYPLLNDLESVK